MNYANIYDNIIKKRQTDIPVGYIEKHHIIPKSMGGTEDESNIVKLTGREHYIAHLLLAKINPCQQSLYALWMMQCGNKYHKRPNIRNSKMYAWARKKFAEYIGQVTSKANFGENNPMAHRRWISHIANKKCKVILKDQQLPNGWVYGRNAWIRLENEKHITDERIRKQNELKGKYVDLYNLYNASNFTSIREFANSDLCEVSQPSLTRSWKKYITEFNPTGRTSHNPAYSLSG